MEESWKQKVTQGNNILSNLKKKEYIVKQGYKKYLHV